MGLRPPPAGRLHQHMARLAALRCAVRRRYRMHVKLEQLVGDVVLLKDLQTMLLRSGRTGPSDLPRLYADYESD